MTNYTDQKIKPGSSFFSSFDNLNEGKVSEWLEAYGNSLKYFFLGLLFLLTLVFLITKAFSTNSEEDYLQAANDFTAFKNASKMQDSALSQEAYQKVKAMMSKHKELHAAYDGEIAQVFLNQDLLADAKMYTDATLLRTKQDNLEYYSDYAKTTLLISDKQFQEAAVQAKSLQIKMLDALNTTNDPKTLSFGNELFALNLLRIAMLQQELGDKAGELETWLRWKQYAGLKKTSAPSVNINPKAFLLIVQQLAIGTVSLPDYIAYREELLEK